MLKQLIYHDGNGKFTTVETSPQLNSVEEIAAWEQSITVGKTLPPGNTWGIVDQNHQWFNDSLVPKETVELFPQFDPKVPLTPEQVLMVESREEMRTRFENIL